MYGTNKAWFCAITQYINTIACMHGGIIKQFGTHWKTCRTTSCQFLSDSWKTGQETVFYLSDVQEELLAQSNTSRQFGLQILPKMRGFQKVELHVLRSCTQKYQIVPPAEWKLDKCQAVWSWEQNIIYKVNAQSKGSLYACVCISSPKGKFKCYILCENSINDQCSN